MAWTFLAGEFNFPPPTAESPATVMTITLISTVPVYFDLAYRCPMAPAACPTLSGSR